jgi:hypothetical protein
MNAHDCIVARNLINVKINTEKDFSATCHAVFEHLAYFAIRRKITFMFDFNNHF